MSLCIAPSVYKYAFFSRQKFDYDKSKVNRYLVDIVKTNCGYPIVCTVFYGAHYTLQDGTNVFANHISAFPDIPENRKYSDFVLLGKIKAFSHYPIEVMHPEEYSDPHIQYFLNNLTEN